MICCAGPLHSAAATRRRQVAFAAVSYKRDCGSARIVFTPRCVSAENLAHISNKTRSEWR
jgi:hypothetical protein